MRRSDQRRDAVFACYQQDVTGRPLTTLLADAKPFTIELVEGVDANRAEIDEVITEFAKGWELSRIAPLERNILRVALYEMNFRDDVPAEVAIDEAVDGFGDFDEAAALRKRVSKEAAAAEKVMTKIAALLDQALEHAGGDTFAKADDFLDEAKALGAENPDRSLSPIGVYADRRNSLRGVGERFIQVTPRSDCIDDVSEEVRDWTSHKNEEYPPTAAALDHGTS